MARSTIQSRRARLPTTSAEDSRPSSRRRRRIRCEALAAALALTAAAVLSAVALIHPALADRLTVENGVVEWLQVLLNVAAAFLVARLVVRDAGGRVSPLGVVMVAALVALIIRELDLDRRLFGADVISIRFLWDSGTAPLLRLFGAVVMIGAPALAAYAFAWPRTLLREEWACLAEPWGRVFVASAVIVALTTLFERQLGRVGGVPHHFLEELLELVAAIGFLVAVAARPRWTPPSRSVAKRVYPE
jgi:hypothetical protein